MDCGGIPMSPLTGKASQGVHNARQEDYDLRRKVLLNKKYTIFYKIQVCDKTCILYDIFRGITVD